jgi:phenol 2-monooxygenase (NADPH)
VSMQDAFNLGWKLAAVLLGRCGPGLLRTYSDERQAVARDLIAFDREWARMFSDSQVAPEEFRRRYTAAGRYTAGVATRYRPSMITGEATHQQLATGLGVGERFHSAPVIRLADGRPLQLGHVAEADGRWRIYVFSGSRDPRARAAMEHLANTTVARLTPPGADIDSVIDVRLVLQEHFHDVLLETLPPLALPRKGALGLIDYEKVFCGHDIYGLRGIDRDRGCLVVVRPDQYVANVLPLDALDELDDFLSGVLLPATLEP